MIEDSIEKVFLIEHKDDLDNIDFDCYRGAKIIALTASAQSRLVDLGVNYDVTLPFYGVRGHKFVIEESEKILKTVQKDIKKIPLFSHVDENNVKHSYKINLFFHLRFYLHYWLRYLYIIDAVSKQYAPKTLLTAEPARLDTLKARIHHDDRLLGNVAALYAETHNLNIEFIKKSTTQSNKKRHSIGFINVLWPIVFLAYQLKTSNKKLIFFASDTYSMDRIAKEVSGYYSGALVVYLSSRASSYLQKLMGMFSKGVWSFPFVRSVNPKSTKNILQKTVEQDVISFIENVQKINNLFVCREVDYKPQLLIYLRNGLASSMKELSNKTTALNAILSIKRPEIVISQHSLDVGYSLGELCQIKNIPAMLVTHGTHTPEVNKWSNVEWSEQNLVLLNTQYKYVAIQTPWCAKAVQEQKTNISIPVVTGPLLFARGSANSSNQMVMRNKLFKNKSDCHIILHASSPSPQIAYRPWIYETEDEYISNINSIIQAVDGMTNTYLAIRFRPTATLTTNEFKKLLLNSENVGVHDDGSFQEFLLSSDLLVSYSSTTIEEALANKIPVLLYDPDNKYCHLPSQQLQPGSTLVVSSIYSVISANDLEWALACITKYHLNSKNQAKIDWSIHSYKIDDRYTWLNDINA